MDYYYFISTLPMLDFQRPSFDGGIQAFDEMCRNSLSAEDAARLAKVSISNPAAEIEIGRAHV